MLARKNRRFGDQPFVLFASFIVLTRCVHVSVVLVGWQPAKHHVHALGMRCALHLLAAGRQVQTPAIGRCSFLGEATVRAVLVTSYR